MKCISLVDVLQFEISIMRVKNIIHVLSYNIIKILAYSLSGRIIMLYDNDLFSVWHDIHVLQAEMYYYKIYSIFGQSYS